MEEPSVNPDILQSLGRVVRGLSAIFWGLPLALITSAQTDAFIWTKPHTAVLPIIANALILFGLFQLGAFNRQERVWVQALDQSKILATLNLGLSPFLFYWNMAPQNAFFSGMIAFLVVSGLFFLYSLNLVLQRLSAMLPDETLRDETKLFTGLNRNLVLTMAVILILYFFLLQFKGIPMPLIHLVTVIDQSRHMLVVFLVLLPLALTMTMLWKIKGTIFHSVFSSRG